MVVSSFRFCCSQGTFVTKYVLQGENTCFEYVTMLKYVLAQGTFASIALFVVLQEGTFASKYVLQGETFIAKKEKTFLPPLWSDLVYQPPPGQATWV